MHYHESLHNFKVIGISYEKADVETRGQFAFLDQYADDFIQKSKENNIEDFFVLSTCNRTEIYYFGSEDDKMKDIYCDQVQGDKELFDEITFVKAGRDAIHHLFRVSTGIESQILGDFEVLAQMKKAFKAFKKKGTSNARMERIMNTAIQISKQIKNETSLSDGATSVSYAAVQYIIQNIPDFNEKKILLFGTGKIGRNTCENLVKHSDNKHITLVNRTPEKAEALGKKLQLTYKPIEELEKELSNTDILIVATGAPKPTIYKSLLPQDREMLVIDLSIPENVAKDVDELEKIQVLNVDELSNIINKTLKSRESEIPKVETIIRLKLWEFEDWIESRKYVPAIEAFKDRMEFLKYHEKKQLQKKEVELNGKDPLSERLIQKMTNQFASHIMENPDSADEVIELMNKVFNLELEK
ncbi:glutamyl-tRNA reductase [Weeksellaceae bacterium KMM 9713]|uniref:Glutamyl-tRNA reductase n=1 Tax=Profundicola chukchiensis TaxID=2961959 RepID=A0A9X4RTX9_9FLAO|nr:glutamyl-tRNA reductase [Profundicola chukchiensis]MDG4945538.1 glutamyl-tRNA reductase [Profundicola chukchiensis]MDG4949528.1 glutamyl-tRNA reductase [Profundicola chukchiensis]